MGKKIGNFLKFSFVIVYFLLFHDLIHSQNYNQERTALTNFLIRMYENSPFDGVRAVEDYENAYLMSVVKLDKTKYKNDSDLNRVASVKAMSQASRFFNGSNISSDLIIRTSDNEEKESETEIIENIREHSSGYVKQLEQLTNFPSSDNKVVFIFLTPLNINK